MRRNHWTLVVTMIGVAALLLGGQTVAAQSRREGRLLRSYRRDQGARPAWVDAALRRGIAGLRNRAGVAGLRDAARELDLLTADEDDLGQIHLRLDQVRNSIPVFGSQLVVSLDANNVRDVLGQLRDTSGANLRPQITPAQALTAAKTAFGYNGDLANQPDAKLVLLPDRTDASKITLTYQVELLVEDGTDRTGRYQYFINAADGSVVWSYNNMDHAAVTGTGNSLYSGTVSIGTDQANGSYSMTDPTRGGLNTTDMQNRWSQVRPGVLFTDSDNVWGNGSNSNRQTAGVDAHFGASKTWDYYLNVHGRRGIDGNGYTMRSRVHYGKSYVNAFWDGVQMTYGDGDGVQSNSLVTVDVAGHEITHGLTEKTAGLIYDGESGGANESFSDIFGTAIEFYTGSVGGKQTDYLIGEDCWTPGTSGDALRSMADPASDGSSIDNYSKYVAGIDVHYSSGIQNNAFYLLSEGGKNKTSGLSVSGISRAKAEKIFYRALTVKLTASATFKDVRTATLSAAADLYGNGSAEYNATAQAWTAVGVQ